MIDQNPSCKSELVVNRYATMKDKSIGNFFKPHPEKDVGNLHFQNIKSELMAARYSKNWQDFTHCQSTNLNFGKKND